MGETDKQFSARLIEEYYYNLEILKLAEEEKSEKTAKTIRRRLEMIKLQLQPIELPEIPND